MPGPAFPVNTLPDNADRLTNLGTLQGAPQNPIAIQSYAYTLDAAGKRTAIGELDGTKKAPPGVRDEPPCELMPAL